MFTIRKISLTLLAILVLLGGCQAKKQVEFDDFLTSVVQQQLQDDALNTHFYFVDGHKYGIENKSVSLGKFGQQEINQSLKKTETILSQLTQVDRTKLTSTQQVDYDLLKQSLEQSLALFQYQDLQFLFEPDMGLTSGIIQSFLEYRMTTQEDVQTYLTLLKDVSRYLKEAIKQTQSQAQRGYALPDISVYASMAEIDKFTQKKQDNSLSLNFETKVRQIEELSDKTQKTWIAENQKIMMESVIPAFETVSKELGEMVGLSQLKGLAGYPKGDQYYQLLLQQKSSTNLSCEALFKKTESYMLSLFYEVRQLLQENPTLLEQLETIEFPLQDANEILQVHRQNLTPFFPDIQEVQYTVENLDPSVVGDRVLAYYLVPPVDDSIDNVIKVNIETMNENQQLLFLTLAHEGFPGHCYQQNYFLQTKPHPIRQLLNYSGYSEGWAKMVELEAFHWSTIKNEKLIRLCQINSVLGYLLECLVDMGVNGLNWSTQETVDYLSQFNYEALASTLRESVIQNPAALIPYGIGYMEMDLLRSKAKRELGDQYQDQQFYATILKKGPMPFDYLEQQVQDYIEETK